MGRLRLFRLAKGDLVFNPRTQLGPHIKAASKLIASYFDDVDAALDDGSSIKRAVLGDDIQAAISRVIQSSRLAGFQHAAKFSKKQMPPLYGRFIKKSAAKRSGKVNKMMARTTKTRLRQTPDSEHVLSEDRAIAAAHYEAARAYYRGVRDGFAGTGFEKAWNCGGDNPCDNCDENEQQDYINVDEPFDSGHPWPLAHLNCQCFITIRKGK